MFLFRSLIDRFANSHGGAGPAGRAPAKGSLADRGGAADELSIDFLLADVNAPGCADWRGVAGSLFHEVVILPPSTLADLPSPVLANVCSHLSAQDMNRLVSASQKLNAAVREEVLPAFLEREVPHVVSLSGLLRAASLIDRLKPSESHCHWIALARRVRVLPIDAVPEAVRRLMQAISLQPVVLQPASLAALIVALGHVSVTANTSVARAASNEANRVLWPHADALPRAQRIDLVRAIVREAREHGATGHTCQSVMRTGRDFEFACAPWGWKLAREIGVPLALLQWQAGRPELEARADTFVKSLDGLTPKQRCAVLEVLTSPRDYDDVKASLEAAARLGPSVSDTVVPRLIVAVEARTHDVASLMRLVDLAPQDCRAWMIAYMADALPRLGEQRTAAWSCLLARARALSSVEDRFIALSKVAQALASLMVPAARAAATAAFLEACDKEPEAQRAVLFSLAFRHGNPDGAAAHAAMSLARLAPHEVGALLLGSLAAAAFDLPDPTAVWREAIEAASRLPDAGRAQMLAAAAPALARAEAGAQEVAMAVFFDAAHAVPAALGRDVLVAVASAASTAALRIRVLREIRTLPSADRALPLTALAVDLQRLDKPRLLEQWNALWEAVAELPGEHRLKPLLALESARPSLDRAARRAAGKRIKAAQDALPSADKRCMRETLERWERARTPVLVLRS